MRKHTRLHSVASAHPLPHTHTPAPGTYKTAPGNVECTDCLEGNFCLGASADKKECATGSYCPAGATFEATPGAAYITVNVEITATDEAEARSQGDVYCAELVAAELFTACIVKIEVTSVSGSKLAAGTHLVGITGPTEPGATKEQLVAFFTRKDPSIVAESEAAAGTPCPTQTTCTDAKEWCLGKSYTGFTCHRTTALQTSEYTCSADGGTICTGPVDVNLCAETPVALGAAADFAVLAGATVTSTGLTRIRGGDLGVSPGTAVTGFTLDNGKPPVGGTGGAGKILDGTIHPANDDAADAQVALTAAFNYTAQVARTTTCELAILVSGDLGGLKLRPAIYKSTSSLHLTGDVTLDAENDAGAVFIFQMGSTFVSAEGSRVLLANGANAKNVFWQVGSSGTLGAASTLVGTMMADQSITMGSLATVNGRVLASNGAVTMLSAKISLPCDGGTLMVPCTYANDE
jgi:hypothetical protein